MNHTNESTISRYDFAFTSFHPPNSETSLGYCGGDTDPPEK